MNALVHPLCGWNSNAVGSGYRPEATARVDVGNGTDNRSYHPTHFYLPYILSLLFFYFLQTSRRWEGGIDQHEILDDGTYRSQTGLLPFWGHCPQKFHKSEILGLNFGHLTTNILKTVSCSVTGQLKFNISSMRSF